MQEQEAPSQYKGCLNISLAFLTFFLGSFFIIMALNQYTKMIMGFWLITLISIYVFLYIRKKIVSKIKYFIFVFPIICLIAIIAVVRYDRYVAGIPKLIERGVDLHKYEPFSYKNNLAILEENSNFKITEKFPLLDGATAFYPLYASFVQAVYPQGRYDFENSMVLCSTTINAYTNLLERKADIIFCLEPSEDQKKQFSDNGLKLKFYAIGKEAFVVFVNKNNPIDNLTIDEFIGIYSGKIKNWKKINGVNQSIRAFQREKNSGSQTILEKIMGNIPIENPLLNNH